MGMEKQGIKMVRYCPLESLMSREMKRSRQASKKDATIKMVTLAKEEEVEEKKKGTENFYQSNSQCFA